MSEGCNSRFQRQTNLFAFGSRGASLAFFCGLGCVPAAAPVFSFFGGGPI